MNDLLTYVYIPGFILMFSIGFVCHWFEKKGWIK